MTNAQYIRHLYGLDKEESPKAFPALIVYGSDAITKYMYR